MGRKPGKSGGIPPRNSCITARRIKKVARTRNKRRGNRNPLLRGNLKPHSAVNHRSAAFLAILLQTGPGLAAEPVIVPTSVGQARAAGMESLLARVSLPNLDFKETSFEDALAFLRAKSNGAATGAEKVNFVVEDPDGKLKDRQVKWLRLRNVPARAAVRYLMPMYGARVRYDAHAIVISPSSGSEDTGAGASSRQQRTDAALEKVRETQLSKVTIATVDFSEATLQDALEYLSSRADVATKDGVKVDFVVGDQAALSRPIKWLRLKNLPLSAAIRTTLRQCGFEPRYDEQAIACVPLRPDVDDRTEQERMMEEAATRNREAKLAQVVIPKVHLDDASLEEALTFLGNRINEKAGDKLTVNFVIDDPAAVLAAKRIHNLQLREIPARDALAYLLAQCSATARYDPHMIVITPAKTAAASTKVPE